MLGIRAKIESLGIGGCGLGVVDWGLWIAWKVMALVRPMRPNEHQLTLSARKHLEPKNPNTRIARDKWCDN